MYHWSPEISDEDSTRSWLCLLPDGDELCVEQITMRTGQMRWKSMVRIGGDGDYLVVSNPASESSVSRIKAQERAEAFYLAKKIGR